MDIDKVLEKAPAAIALYAEKENSAYSMMIACHDEYKRLWSKKYLELRAATQKAVKDIECMLELDEELSKIKNKEMSSEIDYRAWRTRRDKANNMFIAAQEMGRTRRTELKSLNDTVVDRERRV